MKAHHVAATMVATVILWGASTGAQQPGDSTARRQQRTLDSLAAALRGVQARLDSLERLPSAPGPAAAAVRTSGAYMNVSLVGLTDVGWSSTPDVQSLERGDHDPKVRGFTIPNVELALDGTVDPYFKGFSNIVYKLTDTGETDVELEEMYLLSSALPLNLQLKVGQYFVEFGRQNPQHPHAWAFADQPIVLNRMFGPDGLRTQGVRLSWLLPTPFYAEAGVAAMNSVGNATFSFRSAESSQIHGGAPLDRDVKGLGELLYVPRIATSFDLTDDQTLLFGVSGAFGPNNSGVTARTAVYGADVYWKWKPPAAREGFPFVSFQSEYLTRRYDAALRSAAADSHGPDPSFAAETLKDDGAYAQLLWGIRPRVIVGVRGEYVNANKSSYTTPERADRARWCPDLTWYPSEFSKVRLQYNYDRWPGAGAEHSLWLQFEFLLGAHAAHKF